MGPAYPRRRYEPPPTMCWAQRCKLKPATSPTLVITTVIGWARKSRGYSRRTATPKATCWRWMCATRRTSTPGAVRQWTRYGARPSLPWMGSSTYGKLHTWPLFPNLCSGRRPVRCSRGSRRWPLAAGPPWHRGWIPHVALLHHRHESICLDDRHLFFPSLKVRQYTHRKRRSGGN